MSAKAPKRGYTRVEGDCEEDSGWVGTQEDESGKTAYSCAERLARFCHQLAGKESAQAEPKTAQECIAGLRQSTGCEQSMGEDTSIGAPSGAVDVHLSRGDTGFGLVISRTGIVASVDLQGAAAAADVKEGWQIVRLDGRVVQSRDEIVEALRTRQSAVFTLSPPVPQYSGVVPNARADNAQASSAPNSVVGASECVQEKSADAGAETAAAVDVHAALQSLIGPEAEALVRTLRGQNLLMSGSLSKMGDVRLQRRHFLLFGPSIVAVS